MRIEKQGFKSAIRSDIVVSAGSTITINAQLEIGAVTESVQVSAALDLLQTTTAKVASAVTNKMVDELPLVVGGAMRGAFDRARALAAAGHASAEALGQTFSLAAEGMIGWEVETLAGDPSAAELNARQSCELLEQLGDSAVRSLASGQLAESLYALGRLDEARQWTEAAEERRMPA